MTNICTYARLRRALALTLSLMLCAGVGAARAAETVTYYHTDALGTPVMESNAAGAVTYAREHRPYGEQSIGAVKGGPGFTGHVADADTGLTYMEARYYDPTSARFLSNDPLPVELSTGINYNRYWYANNNPYKFVDPDGMQAKQQREPAPCENVECRRERQEERRRRSDSPFTGASPRRAEYTGRQLDIRLGSYAGPDEISGVIDSHAKSGLGSTTTDTWTGPRYTYTKKLGWIDLKHVTVSTLVGNGNGFSLGLVWELGQKLSYPDSAFAIEDRNSNFIGSVISVKKHVYNDSRSIGQIAQIMIQGYDPISQKQAYESLSGK